MNELIKMRNSNTCQLEPAGKPAASSPKGGTSWSERGKCGMRSAGGTSSSWLKFSPVFIFSLLVFLFSNPAVIQAQGEEVELPPTPHKESLPPESYNFAMKLPLGTDCSIRIAKKGGKTGAGNQKSDSDIPMKLERSFRKGISSSKEITSTGKDMTFYFVSGLCAYDSPTQGANVVRRLAGHDNSNLATYDFPELTWAAPELRQSKIEVENGKPAVRVYKLPDENLVLEVDASSGFPLRFIEGEMEWTYAYTTSSSPIVLPESLKKPLLQISGAVKDKPQN